ncbi:g11552 [Coccomyxa elongata]
MGQGYWVCLIPLALLMAICVSCIRPGALTREDKVIGWSESYQHKDSGGQARSSLMVEHISWYPRLFLYRSLLTPEECDHIISVARPNMIKATVLDGKTKKQVPNKLRNNKETYLDGSADDIIQQVERRIARYTFLPTANGEPLHIMQYLPGQGYAPHTDFLDDWWHPRLGNERIATMIIYLSDVLEGGETVFPNSTGPVHVSDPAFSKCAQQGVAVKPVKGDALLLYNLMENGRNDGASMHQGCPVIRGEKWTATKRILVNHLPTPEEVSATKEAIKSASTSREAMSGQFHTS